MHGNSIYKNAGYDGEPWTYIPVAVIGSGESGIAMGCRLKEVLGFDQFRIFDRQSGIGGTWWINRYPGVACDVPAIFYSYSFSPNPSWEKFFPSGPEILRYLMSVCDKYQLQDKIQLNSEVREARWDETEQVWMMKVHHMVAGVGDLSAHDRQREVDEHGYESVFIGMETVKAKCLVSAVGGLVEPNIWPTSIPGKDNFQGPIFHSARWRHDVDFKDKNVVVVGTGCSAAQFVPRMRKDYGAKSVTQVMRSPPWVVPRPVPPRGNEWWNKWSPWLNKNIPGFQTIMRKYIFALSEYSFRLYGGSDYAAKERTQAEKALLANMKKAAPQKYHEILTPDYGVGCKRRIFDVEWLSCFHDPQIELTTLPLTGVMASGIVLGPGRSYPPMSKSDSKVPVAEEEVYKPADVIILANGFQTTKWLLPLSVYGRSGKDITQVFNERGGPQMYMGLALDDFPNFFAILGPNTGTGHSSAILAAENGVNLSLKLIAPILRGEAKTVEVKKSAEEAYTRRIQGALKETVWQTGGCVSWYKSKDTDWNGKSYPHSQIWYTLRCLFPTWSDWDIVYSKSALIKVTTIKALKYTLLATTLLLALALLPSCWRHGGASYSSMGPVLAGLQRSRNSVGAYVGRELQTLGGKLVR